MVSHSRSNEIATLFVAISFFIVAILVSARSTINGWSSFLYIAFYFVLVAATYFSSMKIFASGANSNFRSKLLVSAFIFFMFSFYVVGDDGDNSAYYWQGNSYDSVKDMPRLIRMFEGISSIVFIAAGISFLYFLVKFSKSAE